MPAGCLTCKRRRLKCDEEIPSCQRCVKLGVECPGYTKPMKWSTKYEKQLVIPSTTRGLPAESSRWFEEGVKKASEAIKAASLTKNQENTDTSEALLTDTNSNSPTSTTVTSAWKTSEEEDQLQECGMASVDEFSIDLSAISSWANVSDDLSFMDDVLNPIPQLRQDEVSCLLNAPVEQSSVLLGHYYSYVCRINSCFDSMNNPFRSEVSEMIIQSPLIYYCVLSMSAAHMYRNEMEGLSVSLGFQTEAISQLSYELSAIDLKIPRRSLRSIESTSLVTNRTSLVKDDVLLGIILLGMTSAWHDASSLGLSHLHGSRPLFQSWASLNDLDDTNENLLLTQRQSFLVSSMVYWEALVSFLVDQETEALSYLDVFFCQNPSSTIYPSPWTGVGTPIFICLAKTGTLLRKKRLLSRLSIFKSGRFHQNQLYSQLVDEARNLACDAIGIRLPFVSLIEESGDPHATSDNLLQTARCYRLATLIELFRAFPEIIKSATMTEQAEYLGPAWLGEQAQAVLGLAISALNMLQNIPRDSNLISTQNLLLLIVGSALAQVYCTEDDASPSERKLNDDVIRQREFVYSRLQKLQTYIGLRPIIHTKIILDEVWARMDIIATCGTKADYRSKIFSDQIHWMDIMSEKRLDTILG